MSIIHSVSRRGDKGFTLVEVLMSLAISMIVVGSISSFMVWTTRSQANAIQSVQLETIMQNITKTLRSNTAWLVTLNAAQNRPAMDCLHETPAIACPANVPTPFALYDGGGALVFDATVPTAGFTPQGSLCPPGVDFDMVNGNDNCPYRYELRWHAVCDPAGILPCTSRQILVTGHFFYRPSRNSPNAFALNEDRYSINGVYVQIAPPCTGGAQQVFLFTTAPTTPLTTNFVVPVYTRNLYVEMWGGGGGGASFQWTTSQYTAGNPGGDTTFNSPLPVGPITAAGGTGSSGNTQSVQSWWYINPPPMWIWTGAGSCDGSPAGPPNANLLDGLSNKCTALSSTNNGGQGGVCDWSPFFQPARDGKLYGGGGASSGAWLTDCGAWAFLYNPVNNVDNGGRYQSAIFTPATLPPGTVVQITVGAGGTGAVGNHVLACWGVVPTNGGAGANGLVKITWE